MEFTPLVLKIMNSSLAMYPSTGYGLPFSLRKSAFSSAVNSLMLRDWSLKRPENQNSYSGSIKPGNWALRLRTYIL